MRFTEAIGIISSIKECVQWVGSALAYLRPRWTGTSEQQQLLRDTIVVMRDLIDRAEWRIHESHVAEFLPRLKDAVYDAEDLLDEFRWFEQNTKLGGDPRHSSPVEFFRNVIQDSPNKVSNILEKLDYLSNQLGSVRDTPQRFDKSIRPDTSSFPIEPKIFGRHNELGEVIKLLGVTTTIASNNSRAGSKRKRANTEASQPSTSNHATTSALEVKRVANVPVLPIVGMGGVGKTTLTQHICKHPRVKSHFDLIMWICVSDDFNVKRLTKEAIHSSSSSDKETTIDYNLDTLQRTLAKNIDKKKFLLVLDDMWDDALRKNGQCWKEFCAPLTDAYEGSMILVTTRCPGVADLVKTIEPYPLKGLKDSVFWDFFKLCAFGSETGNNDLELESIGRSIVPKLKGNPLAAKTLGRLLRMNQHTTHWNAILKSELWELKQKEDEILPALRVSYMYLPYHLKRCFSFCAVYSKDHKFKRDSLVEIWVAEGFVEPQEGGILIQEVGGQYFDDLVNRSFFQRAPRSSAYVIHDLMHDVAQLVSKEECFIVKDESDLGKVPPNVRHLSVSTSGTIDRPKLLSLCEYKKVRTLFYNGSVRKKDFDDHWFRELGQIRVFLCRSMRMFPERIGNLKHLRYIQILTGSLRTLPPSFCFLYNLQFLYAETCEFESLPSDFSKLVNLQRIESQNLQYVSGKLTCKALGEGRGIRVLKNINQFGGDLTIDSLYKRAIKNDFAEAELNKKKLIDSLELIKLESQEFEGLHPPANLKSLRLESYHGEYFPSWFQSANLPCLTSLEVEMCDRLVSISFPNTSCGIDLNEIPISSMLVDNNINSNFGVFSSLTDLSISQCYNLSSLQELLQPACLPAIKKIRIKDCRMLVSLPAERFGDFRSLEELEVSRCRKISLSQSVLALPSSLRILKLINCGHLADNIGSCLQMLSSNLAALEKLEIEEFNYLTLNGESQGLNFPLANSSIASGTFASLTVLFISSWKKLTSLDDLLTPNYLPVIERICVEYCGELVSLGGYRFGGFHSLKYLKVSDCPCLNWQKGLVLPSSLQELGLLRCGKDISYCIPGCLETLTSLVSLTLIECPGITSIPGSLWTSNLVALQKLTIWECPDLVSIGGRKAIAKIKDVFICDCPKLKQIKQPFYGGRSRDPCGTHRR